MVTSQIKPEVIYEKTGIDQDIDHDASVYEMEILGKNIEIVLGKEREKDYLSYFIGYVVLDNSKVRPIGVFEIEKSKLENALDEDGDVDLDKMTGPLLFDNVDLSNSLIPIVDDISDSGLSTQLLNEDTLSSDRDTILAELPHADRNKEDEEKELVTTGLWVQQLMQNKNYSIVDNEGGGDCLFAVIRDAFNELGKKFTVGDLRKILSNEVTLEVFENYRFLYSSFEDSIKQTKNKLNEIAKENNVLKEQLPKETNTSKQIAIVERAKKLKAEFNRLKEELSVSKQMLEEQIFMKNITTIDQFKAKINTCRFWGDTWAISTLERVLNAKFILLSEENFLSYDIDNVLQCGQLNDKILEEKGIFTPDYYIVMDYNGTHYKLITYKDHSIFKYKQIPHGIRDMILNKCLEKLSGPYSIIPDFMEEKFADTSGADTSGADTSGADTSGADTVSNVQSLNLDHETVFIYYGRSNSKPLPGKGTGEKIRTDRRDTYKKLASIKEWRKKLSNQWVAPIDVDGHQWKSVEHYYQGSKYKKSKPDIYYKFTLDSRSELGKSVEHAKKFKDFEPDMDFFGKRGIEVLKEALEAKFTQHPDLRRMLLSTNDATLLEYIPKKPSRISYQLMELRKNLSV